ncbi:MAG: hypothetical protein ACRDKH_05125 [Solirubrobacterales bacterium]
MIEPTTTASSEIEAMRWYHTIELADGTVTPGEYDLRPVMERLPMPDSLQGMRCIDVGSRDGYDLDPSEHGQFDFAMLGALLVQLRDPVGALVALRRVVTGTLLINDAVSVGVDLLRRRAVAELYMQGGPFWWMCNPAGLRRMAEAAGFRVVDSSRPFLIPHGKGGLPHAPRLRGPLRSLPRRLAQRRGALHVWVLAAAS